MTGLTARLFRERASPRKTAAPSPVVWDPTTAGVLLDLDETLVLSSAIEPLRRERRWSEVYDSLGLTTLPPGTLPFLEQAGRLGRLGVITMAPRGYAERVLAHHRLTVPVLVAYHDVTRRKPDPEPIIRAATQLGLAPERCVYVGDAGTDMVAANAAGAVPIGISWDGKLFADPDRKRAFALCRNWPGVIQAVESALRERLGDA